MTSIYTASLTEADYNTIEDALLASNKGRRFLRVYIERNRSHESHKLLESIARLHRATVGAPGLEAAVRRDLEAALRNMSYLRETVKLCGDGDTRSALLFDGLQQVEARLLALHEAIEDRAGDYEDDTPALDAGNGGMEVTPKTAQLFGELSSLFAVDARPRLDPHQ